MKLSKKSKELMLFFTKNNHINKVNQSKHTDDIICELYKDIYNAYKYLNNLKQKGKYYTISTKKIVFKLNAYFFVSYLSFCLLCFL